MKVSNINSITYPKKTFTSLKISYDAENILADKANAYQINALFEAGRKLENTVFFDMELFGDMSMRIKEKANPFSGLVEPLQLYKHNAKQIRVIGVYDGLEDETHKKGQKTGISLKYESQDSVERILKDIKPLKGILKVAAITKLIDDYFVKTKIEQKTPQQLSKRGIVAVLMSKFGDLVVK